MLSTENFIYNGVIRHRRHNPFRSEFSYSIFMIYLDIGDLDSILKKSLFWNVNKPAIVSFNRADFHGDTDISLDDAVRNTIENRLALGLKEKLGCLRIFAILDIVLTR